MTGKLGIVSLIFGLWLILPAASPAKGPDDAVVSVVGLDEQGNPRRQGLGILLGKDGRILTSASVLAGSRGGVVKTSDGTLHFIRKVLLWDTLQDLALVEVDAESLTAAPVEISGGLRPPEKVRIASSKKGGARQEAQVTKTLPLSPRLVLLKMEPDTLETELGAPILNSKGELVGMLHGFSGAQEKGAGCQFYLLRDRAHLPLVNRGKEEVTKWPEEPLENQASPVHQAFWEGVRASLRQEWQGALEKFTKAIAPPENLPEAYYGRGIARYHLGDLTGAEKDLLEAEHQLPGYGLAFLWLGKIRVRQGKRAEARQALEQAASASPDLHEAWFQLGKMAYQDGNLALAKEGLERALGDSTYTAQSWWYLGNIARSQHRQQDALAAYNEAIKLKPDFYRAYLEAGKMLVEDEGQAKEAVDLLQNAVRLEPRQAPARYYLALAYLLSWNPAGAWEQYFALQEISPDLAASLAPLLEKK
jgi:tetratricopeptide (TPR) repeat protein